MLGVVFRSPFCQLAFGLEIILFVHLLLVVTGVACSGADVVNSWVLVAPILQIAAD